MALQEGIDSEEHSSESFFAENHMLERYGNKIIQTPELKTAVTFQESKKLPIYNWFKYTQGFSPSLLHYFERKWAIEKDSIFLDPFVGSGTSMVYAQRKGWDSEGWDLSPLAIFLSIVKTTEIPPCESDEIVKSIFKNRKMNVELNHFSLPIEIEKLAKKAFSPRILTQILQIRQSIETLVDESIQQIAILALITSLEETSYIRKHGSHYRFMNTDNSGVQQELDFSNIDFEFTFKNTFCRLISEATEIPETPSPRVRLGDARTSVLKDNKATHIITSPPYLNRNNYIAQSKLEMFLSGLLTDFSDYRSLTHSTLRSHVEATKPVKSHSFKCPIIDDICSIVKERGESYKGVSKMISGYFEDMDQVMRNLVNSTKIGTKIALAIGCSRWSGVVVPTDLLIAHHAVSSGHYTLKDVNVVRYKGNSPQQMARWGRFPVRESIITLERK
jgi:hypothetical protein